MGRVKTEDMSPEVNLDNYAVMDIDPDSLDPSMHYRVISARSTRLARARMQGYRPVTSADGVRRLSQRDEEEGEAEETVEGADGTIRVGDGILMACPKEVYERRVAASDKIKRGRLRAPEGQFRKKKEAAERQTGLTINVDTSKE